MMQVNTPVESFFDTDGTALDDGYIYIGASGLNPETNPQTVYWDKDGLIPALQPIRTRNGYPYRDGAASKFYTATANYSVTVRNKTGQLVFSVLDTDSGIFDQLALSAGAASIGYDNTASGLTATDVQDSIDELATDIETVSDDLVILKTGKNYVDNVFFRKFRRGEGLIGYTPTLTAGQFVVDRWKAGSGGLTLSGLGTSPLPPTITIVSGTIAQQLRAEFSAFYENDTVVMGWDGGAEGRINGGAWSASPLAYNFASATLNPEIEFRVGTDGQLSNVRLRVGIADREIGPDDRIKEEDEYEYLSRYYRQITYHRQAVMSTGEVDRLTMEFSPMILNPTVTVIATTTNVNVSAFSTTVLSREQIFCSITATAAAATHRVSLLGLDTGY
jgi:hypothetical protein